MDDYNYFKICHLGLELNEIQGMCISLLPNKDTIIYIPMTHNEYYETPECIVIELAFREKCMNTASPEDMNLGGEYNI